MRCLEINKRKFHYCNYVGLTDVLDEDNNLTGEKIITYSDPIEYHANISTIKGDTQFEFFGDFKNYDRVIMASDPTWEIDENSVLFVDKEVEYDDDKTPLFDYIVTKVAPSLNGIAVAIKRVE